MSLLDVWPTKGSGRRSWCGADKAGGGELATGNEHPSELKDIPVGGTVPPDLMMLESCKVK